MSIIKSLIVITNINFEIELRTHNSNFVYSRTGNVKFDGIYKPKYFKKEVLNSYEPIKIGKNTFLLFTDDFDIDKNKCLTSVLTLFIKETESKIKHQEEYINLLKNQLNKQK